MASKHQKGRFTFPVALSCVGLVLWSILVTSCNSGGPYPPATPSPILNPALRPLIAVDIEVDTPPLYSLGREVALTIANTIDTLATRINSQGMVIFVCRISSHSYGDCPVNFETPAIPAFTLPPSAPNCGSDPYTCSSQKQQYQKALAGWQVLHTREVTTLSSLTAQVHSQTNAIRSLQLPYDDKGSDIFGALATGATNLQGIHASSKYIVLASDFISTTSQQGMFSLASINVVAVYRTCSDNAYCQQSNSYWNTFVRRAGAVSFSVYSPAQSQALGLQIANA